MAWNLYMYSAKPLAETMINQTFDATWHYWVQKGQLIEAKWRIYSSVN